MVEASHAWILIAVLLILVCALTGDFTVLALALAAAIGAAVALLTDFGALAQVGIVAASALVLGPVLYLFVRPLLNGPKYGVVGTGAEHGELSTVERHNDRPGVRYKHDFFPARSDDGAELEIGQTVQILRFDGITAVVRPQPTSNTKDR